MSLSAMKQALEAMEDHAKQYPHMQKGYTVDAITALRQAIEQAEQTQPVAVVADHPERIDWLRNEPPDGTLLYTAPPQRQPLEGVIDVKPIGYHSLQLVFDSQGSIERFKAAHGIRSNDAA